MELSRRTAVKAMFAGSLVPLSKLPEAAKEKAMADLPPDPVVEVVHHHGDSSATCVRDLEGHTLPYVVRVQQLTCDDLGKGYAELEFIDIHGFFTKLQMEPKPEGAKQEALWALQQAPGGQLAVVDRLTGKAVSGVVPVGLVLEPGVLRFSVVCASQLKLLPAVTPQG